MAELAGAHARHDPMRLAGAVDRGARLGPIEDLCSRCIRLYAELVALTAALPLAALPVRPRDYRLSDAQASRLRARGWRGWWASVGSARDSLTRPLALGFTTLGLAGLLLTAGASIAPFMGAAGSAASAAPMEVSIAAAASAGPVAGSPGTAGTASPPMPTGGDDLHRVASDPSATVGLSVGMLLAGGSLFAARRVAVRGRRIR